MLKVNYNPDVLSCLANLSNDEVFTPPGLANDMLNLLPADLWQNPKATFLDPVCKSGVFLREIAKRLDKGLITQISDPQERINHIFSKQLYGLGITDLTALLSRRSVYGSKTANGKYSFCESFNNEQGNIHFTKMKHTWKGGKCTYCGANQEVYDRDESLETYAYSFIHTDRPEQYFSNMQFDVIIGNPPYQLNDGGFGKSAAPLYHKFVQQAKKLNPKYLTMIIPSRWFAGGKGLDDFRREMINDKRIRRLVDFENANDCFPGVDIAGGICYFLWERGSNGECDFVNVVNGSENLSTRPLNEFPTIIRNSGAVPIIRKVLSHNETKMNNIVSSRKPFGIPTNGRPKSKGDIILRWQNGEGPYKRSDVTVGMETIDDWKVITSYVGYDHAGNPGKDGKRKVFSKIEILKPGTICTETYLVIGNFKTEQEANNLKEYMMSKFFRFLVSQFMFSHHITKESYQLVPIQNFQESWFDEKLYEKYALDWNEVELINNTIRDFGKLK